MQITITLDTESIADLAGLTALISALSGQDVTTTVPRLALPTADTPAPVAHPLATSEQLLAQEARRAAGEPGGTTATGAASPASGSAQPERDSAGVPYDARIHTSGDTKTNQDGTWRKRRGVDDATYAAVLAEISGGAPEAPPAPLAASADAPEAPTTTEAPAAPVADNAATASGAVVAASASSALFDATLANGSIKPVTTFADFVGAVNGGTSPSPTYESLNQTANSLGVAKFADMKDKSDLWQTFYAMLTGG